MRIGTINVDETVQGLTTTLKPRAQSKEKNLFGDYLIDRGALKYELRFKLNLVTDTEWAALRRIMREASFPVTFWDDEAQSEITRRFTTDSLPAPVLRRMKKPDGSPLVYYSEIKLTLEEM